MIILGFAAELVPLVKNRTKTLTYRLGTKYVSLKQGDIVQVKNSSDNVVFGRIEILEVTLTTFQKLPLNNPGHETYSSKEEQRKKFEQYYRRKILNQEPVIILRFEFLG